MGNIGTIADGVIGQTNTYCYDDLNRLISATAGTPSGAMPNTFPITSNIDSFNRANGAPGIVWVGDTTSTFSISSNKLAVSNASTSTLSWKDAFGADQEASVTLSTIQASSGMLALGLKAQDNTQCNNLQVRYLPGSNKVQVFACSSGTSTQQGADISVGFAAGDKFGARAKSNGTVEVYKNGTLVGSVTVAGSWPYLALGGKIGLGASNASGTIFDDFGGGSLPTPPAASSESYSYDTIGNLTTKAGVNYSYPTAGQARPHTPSSVAGVNRTYDANGNLTGGDSRIYTWNYDNKPSSVTGIDGVQEQYGYDGDTNRVYRSRNGITTFYLGQWEEDSTGVKKQYYSFGGSTVAMRDSLGNLTYLHSDHLGSVSLATTSNGNIASQQYFDPWGKVKSGGIGQTSLNYTGQRLDGTGLLYYNARYYDPALGKFLTPDTEIPGADSQNQNRYTYVRNNPLRLTDITGHAAEDVINAAQERLKAQVSNLDAKVKNGGGAQAQNELDAVNQNVNYLLNREVSPEDKASFCDFMSKIQAGTIMNYTGVPLLPWENHTAIGIDEGIMMQAPNIGSTVNCLSAFTLWTAENYHMEHVSLYEVPGITAQQRQKAADFARKQFGKPYNWVLADTNYDSFYCTKLVVSALQEAGVKFYHPGIDELLGLEAGNNEFNPWNIADAKVDAGEGKKDLQKTYDGSKDYHKK